MWTAFYASLSALMLAAFVGLALVSWYLPAVP
jgi:hypothetical protein